MTHGTLSKGFLYSNYFKTLNNRKNCKMNFSFDLNVQFLEEKTAAYVKEHYLNEFIHFNLRKYGSYEIVDYEEGKEPFFYCNITGANISIANGTLIEPGYFLQKINNQIETPYTNSQSEIFYELNENYIVDNSPRK